MAGLDEARLDARLERQGRRLRAWLARLSPVAAPASLTFERLPGMALEGAPAGRIVRLRRVAAAIAAGWLVAAVGWLARAEADAATGLASQTARLDGRPTIDLRVVAAGATTVAPRAAALLRVAAGGGGGP